MFRAPRSLNACVCVCSKVEVAEEASFATLRRATKVEAPPRTLLVDYGYHYSALRRTFSGADDVCPYGSACVVRNGHSDKTHLLLFSTPAAKFVFLQAYTESLMRWTHANLASGAGCADCVRLCALFDLRTSVQDHAARQRDGLPLRGGGGCEGDAPLLHGVCGARVARVPGQAVGR